MKDMKTLKIVWQRLLSDNQTCQRCSSTEDELERALKRLKKALKSLDLGVDLEKKEITVASFEKEPSQSNRIWIAEKPLEYWLQADTGQSPCCDVCGDAECRTIEVDGLIYETIPEKLIIKAGLIAAASLIK